MNSTPGKLQLVHSDGTLVYRYIRVSEQLNAGVIERTVELMMTPASAFGPEVSDTKYKGCGVKTTQNFIRWFDITMSQSELRQHYVETTDMTSILNGAIGIVNFITENLFDHSFVSEVNPKIFTTPAQLISGMRSVLDTKFDRRYKIVRHIGANKEATVAKIEHYLLHGFPVVALALNGDHWVTISGITTVCNAENGEMKDVLFNVQNNSHKDSWSWKTLHFWFTDARDEFAEAARDAGYTSYRQGTLVGARYDRPSHQYKWSSGWTTALIYGAAQGQFLFLLKESSGEVHLHRMQNDGGVGEQVASYNWSGGWSTVKFFQTKQGLFLLLLKKSSGEAHIHRMLGDGKVADQVAAYNWSGGWSNAAFYSAGSSPYLILQKISGEVHIHRINVDGTVGDLVEKHSWSAGWTTVKFFVIGGSCFLFLLKAGNGLVHIHRMNDNGTLGKQTAEYNWSAGWTVAEFYQSGNKTFLLIHKAGDPDGIARIHEINSDGTVGTMTDDAYWMAETSFAHESSVVHASQIGTGLNDNNGILNAQMIVQSWPILRVFSPSPGTRFLFQLCTLDGQVEIHPLLDNGRFNNCFVN